MLMNWPLQSPQSPTSGPPQHQNGRPTDLQTERRLTTVEQRLLRLQEIYSLNHQGLTMRLQQSDEDIKEVREELKEIYKHAFRLVVMIASGACLIIFNVLWTGTTASGF